MSITAYQMSDQHKAQLALGREQSKIVRDYLNSLVPARRGRKRTAESVQTQLERVAGQIANTNDPLSRLQLTADYERLKEELASMENGVDNSEIEEEFIRIAAEYSARKGITYSAWRALNVPASVLREAGISRSRVAA